MNLQDASNQFAFNDGTMLGFNLDFSTKQATVDLAIRKCVTKKTLEPCRIRLHFSILTEVNIWEDFPTNGGYSDITLITLDNGQIYVSFDPYGNSGVPNESDNWVIKAGLLNISEIDRD